MVFIYIIVFIEFNGKSDHGVLYPIKFVFLCFFFSFLSFLSFSSCPLDATATTFSMFLFL